MEKQDRGRAPRSLVNVVHALAVDREEAGHVRVLLANLGRKGGDRAGHSRDHRRRTESSSTTYGDAGPPSGSPGPQTPAPGMAPRSGRQDTSHSGGLSMRYGEFCGCCESRPGRGGAGDR